MLEQAAAMKDNVAVVKEEPLEPSRPVDELHSDEQSQPLEVPARSCFALLCKAEGEELHTSATEAVKTITEAAQVTNEKAIASAWAFARRSRSWALRFSAWAAPGQLQEATSLHPAAVALSTRRSASRSMA